MKPLLAVVGDYDPANETHLATDAALEHAGARHNWIGTGVCEGRADELLHDVDGVFIAPASPYVSMQGALDAIQYARERGVPLVGT